MTPFIVMRDGDREAPNIAGYPMERLRDLVTSQASSFGRVLLFVDVCHGGNTTWNVDVRPPLKNLDLIQKLKAKGGLLGILTGSDVGSKGNEASEYAYESKRLQHGVFTFYLLKGLTGSAPVVDGAITIVQLASYVKSEVQSFTRQTTPADYYTDGTLPVVGNPGASKKADLHLVEIPGEEWLVKRGGLPFDDFGLTALLRSGDLLAPKSRIQDALASIRARYGERSTEYADAISRYRVALEEQGHEVITRYLRGDQDPVPAADFDRCGDLFDAAVRLAPDAAFDESRGLFCRGRSAIFSGNYDLARTLLERSIAIDARRSYAYNALGIGLLESANKDPKLLQSGIEAFAEAIRFEPKWAYPRHNLALALSEAGRYREAVATYQNAMEVGPQYSYLPFNLGLLYQSIRNFDEARSAYKLAVKVAGKRCSLRGLAQKDVCPERAVPLAGLASVFAQNGSHRRSEKLYQDAHHDSSSDLLIQHNLASLYAGWKGHEAKAETIWTANLKADPDDLPSLIGYTGLLKHACRFSEAEPRLLRLTVKAPNYEPAKLDLALVETRTGKVKDAQALLLTLKSRSAEYWAAQAEVSEITGNQADAERQWQTALEKAGDSPARKNIERRRSKAAGCPF